MTSTHAIILITGRHLVVLDGEWSSPPGKPSKGVPVVRTPQANALLMLPFKERLAKTDEPEKRRLQITETLREGLTKHAWELPSATLALRAVEAKTRGTRLPSSEPAELAQMAKFEVEKLLPFDRARYLTGAIFARNVGLEGTDTLLVAMDGALVEAGIKGLEGAGVATERTTLGTLGLVALAKNAAGGKREGVELIVHLGLDAMDLIVMRDGAPDWMRGAPSGLARAAAKLIASGDASVDLDHAGIRMMREPLFAISQALHSDDAVSKATATEQVGGDTNAFTTKVVLAATASTKSPEQEALASWLARTMQEVRRTIESGRSQGLWPNVDRILLSGSGAVLVQGLAEHLAKWSGVPTEVLPAWGGLAMPKRVVPPPADAKSKALTLVAEPWSEIEASLAQVAAGCLLEALHQADAKPGATLDLTPEWYLQQRQTERRRRSSIVTGAIALVLVVAAMLYLTLRSSYEAEYIDALRADNELMRPLAEGVTDKEEKLAIVRKHVENKFGAIAVLDLINQLDVVVKGRVRLLRFEFRRGEEMTLRGQAETYADINDFQDSLEKHRDFFTQVINRGQEPRELSQGRKVIQFDFVCYLQALNPNRRTTRGAGRAGGFL